uniref:Probable RNA polymerase II nuclear localization protein SLC7A6OS n=1 Tax=Timema poppense TaxID=170557 RepID=A0A7R9D0Y2_TIMPO|nr:unnamed protein product [Timema poppensis]
MAVAENVALHLSSNLKKDPKTHSHIPDIRSKLRSETKDISQQNRFKVVNCFRALDDQASLEETIKSYSSSTNLENNSTKSLTVVDVESSNTDVSEDKIKPQLLDGPSAEENDHYVYDLYYTGDVDDMLIENLVSVQPLQSDLLYHRRSSSRLSDSEDSEDSNAENNIGNDYPDTEEDNSIDEDDMRAAIRMEDDRFDDLSSDDEAAMRISDLKLDPDDVEKYGISRAFCKASKKGDYDEDEYYFDLGSDSNESSRFA